MLSECLNVCPVLLIQTRIRRPETTMRRIFVACVCAFHGRVGLFKLQSGVLLRCQNYHSL